MQTEETKLPVLAAGPDDPVIGELAAAEYVVMLLAADCYLRYLKENDLALPDDHMKDGVRLLRNIDRQLGDVVLKHLHGHLSRESSQRMVSRAMQLPLDRHGLARRALLFRTALDLGGPTTVHGIFTVPKYRTAAKAALSASGNSDADAALDVFAAIPMPHALVRAWIDRAAELAGSPAPASPVAMATAQVQGQGALSIAAQVKGDGQSPSSDQVGQAVAQKEQMLAKVQAEATAAAKKAADKGGIDDAPPTRSEVVGIAAAVVAAQAANADDEANIPPQVRLLRDPEQRAAAMTDGRVLIAAGAGSGKTTTVCARLAHLVLDRGVAPERVFAGVFNVKAADEIEERTAKLVGDELLKKMTVGTMHGVFGSFIRKYGTAEEKESVTTYLISNPEDGRPPSKAPRPDKLFGIMAHIWMACYGEKPPQGIGNMLQRWKFNNIGPEQALKEALEPNEEAAAAWYAWEMGFKGMLGKDWAPKCVAQKTPPAFDDRGMPQVPNLPGVPRNDKGEPAEGGVVNPKGDPDKASALWWAFIREFRSPVVRSPNGGESMKLGQARLGDFTDMILTYRDILKRDETARKAIQARFDHVIIDEAQDLSEVGHEIFAYMTEHVGRDAEDKSAWLVGDEVQAVNNFVGGKPELFAKPYSEDSMKLTTIRTNHRSYPEIVEVAGALLSHHPRRIPMDPVPDAAKPRGEASIVLERVPTQQHGAMKCVERWTQEHANGADWSRFAVLSRTNAELDAYEMACILNKVPYVKRDSSPFMSSPEIGTVMQYMNFLTTNSYKEMQANLVQILDSPKRFFLSPEEINKAVRKTIDKLAQLNGVSNDMVNPMALFEGEGATFLVEALFPQKGFKSRAAEKMIDELGQALNTVRMSVQEDFKLDDKGVPIYGTKDLIEDILTLPTAPDKATMGQAGKPMTVRDRLMPFIPTDKDEVAGAAVQGDAPVSQIGNVVFLQHLATRPDALDPKDFAVQLQELQKLGKDLRMSATQWDREQRALHPDDPGARLKVPAVTLSTTHSVKGAQWPDTTVVMTAGKWPMAPRKLEARREEEFLTERQLAYVALTRAAENLTVISQALDAKGRPLQMSSFIVEAGLVRGENVPGRSDREEPAPRLARHASMTDELLAGSYLSYSDA